MKNPLTVEERLSVARLRTHDVGGDKGLVYAWIADGKKENAFIKTHHIFSILDSICALISDNDEFSMMDQKDVELKLDYAIKHLKGEYNTKAEVSRIVCLDQEFLTNRSLLYTSLYNLLKNALKKFKDQEGKITVSAVDYEGELSNLVYLSPETPIAGSFIKLSVLDNGQGFPSGRPLSELIKLGATTRGSGFGLYYVNLVCKYLRAHLAIESKPGNVEVAIYHRKDLFDYLK